MVAFVTLPFRSRNTSLKINDASVHPIAASLLAYYDMQTFADDRVTLLDQSGHGKHAVFNAAPEVDLEGVFFRGQTYAMTPLAAPQVKAVFAVVRMIDLAAYPGAGYLLSNWGAGVGTLLQPAWNNSTMAWNWYGQPGTVPENQRSIDLAPMVAERWELRYMRVTADGKALVKNLAGGTAGGESVSSTVPARNWVIGSSWGYNNPEVVDPSFNLKNVKVASLGFADHVLSSQEESWLLDYERTKAKLRGVGV